MNNNKSNSQHKLGRRPLDGRRIIDPRGNVRLYAPLANSFGAYKDPTTFGKRQPVLQQRRRPLDHHSYAAGSSELCSVLQQGTGVDTTLICGPAEFTETLMFEGAMHWAKQGQRVIYVTPNRIESLPPKYHDGSKPTTDIFQLVKFMYLQDYKSLMEVLLVVLDTFNSLPSALIIDKLENYTRSESAPADGQILVAKTCSVIIDAMNACSRILKKRVDVLATVRPESLTNIYSAYFNNVWHLSIDEQRSDGTDNQIITLTKNRPTVDHPSFQFRILEDRTVVLQRILSHVVPSGC